MSSSRLDHLLSFLISILYLILLTALPLLFSMKSSEVFEFPKMLFVYAMTVLIVTCWICRMIVNKRIIYTRTPLDIPIYFFLLSQLLSTFFSIDVHTSIHGFYSRWNGGLLSTVSYMLLYSGYVSNKREAESVKENRTSPSLRFTLYALLGSATIVSIYAILQRLGVDKHLWIQDVVSRVFSTQGQPNWLAAYLVMVVPFALMITANSYLRSHNSYVKDSSPRNFFLHVSSYILVLIYATAVAFTRSRSGLLGFVVADLTFWLVMVWNYMSHQRSSEQQPILAISKKQYRLKTIVYHLYSLRLTQGGRLFFSFVAIHALILVLVLLTNNPAREWISNKLQATSDKRQTTDSSSLPPTTYSLSPDSSITPSSDIRRIVWTGALQLVKERPFFGWGPETFAYTYWRVRPIEHNLTSEWNFLYNKAHNEWLNFAANTGLLGLGMHVLLLVWFSSWSILAISRITNHESRITVAAILAAILGVEIVNVFGFSTVTTQAYSYIFMGIAVAEGRRQKEEGRRVNDLRITNHESRIPFTVYCLLFTVSLVALYLLSQISFLFLADLSYNRGKQFASAGYVQDALPDLESAVTLLPEEPIFRLELAETQGVLAVSLLLQDEGYAAASSLKDSSLENFRIVGKQSPANVSFLRTRARVTYALGSLDPSLYDQGIELMSRAMELAPTDPKIPYNLGVMLQDRGQTDDAKKMFEKSIELKPDYKEAQTILESLSE